MKLPEIIHTVYPNIYADDEDSEAYLHDYSVFSEAKVGNRLVVRTTMDVRDEDRRPSPASRKWWVEARMPFNGQAYLSKRLTFAQAVRRAEEIAPAVESVEGRDASEMLAGISPYVVESREW